MKNIFSSSVNLCRSVSSSSLRGMTCSCVLSDGGMYVPPWNSRRAVPLLDWRPEPLVLLLAVEIEGARREHGCPRVLGLSWVVRALRFGGRPRGRPGGLDRASESFVVLRFFLFHRTNLDQNIYPFNE